MSRTVISVARRPFRVALKNSHLVLSGGLVLLIATTIVNASGFLFHFIVSRQLKPSEYGALGALLGIILVISVPANGLQVAITKQVSAHRKLEGPSRFPVIVGPLLLRTLLWGLVSASAMLVASPFIRDFLHLQSTRSAYLVALFVLPIAVGVVPKSILLGQRRYKFLGSALVSGAAVRLALAATFARAGGVQGALAASVMGEVVTAIILLTSLPSIVRPVENVSALAVRWLDASAALFCFVGFWLLTAIDVVLARHYLDVNTSGQFAAAATAAKAAMFLPAAVAVVTYPRFAATQGRGSDARRALVQALAIVGVLALGASLVMTVLPHFVVTTLFGSQYVDAEAIVGLLSLSATCLALVSVLMHYHLGAQRRVAAALPWLGAACAAVGIARFHDSPRTIVVVMLVTTAGLFLAMAQRAFVAREVTADATLLSRELWDLASPDLDVTIVVPYFNPGNALRQNILRLISVLRSLNASFEVIAVSDGSTDGSELTLEGIDPDVLRAVILPRNAGKGQALRVGLAMGRGQYLGFIDADGDIDPITLDSFLTLVRLYRPDIILGSKRHPMSEVKYPPIRRAYSWGYQQLIRTLFRLNIRDTQTGLKLVRREVIAAVLPRMLEKRFAFDLELFVLARHLGFRNLFEAPVRIDRKFTSTISPKAVWGMFLDTLAIFYRLQLLHFYDNDHVTAVDLFNDLPNSLSANPY